jgi:hypothetical protein
MLHERNFFSLLKGMLRVIAGLAILFGATLAGSSAGPRQASAQVQDEIYYFPLVLNPNVYNGRVTINGQPAAGRTVTMRYWNGSAYSNWASVTTDANGRYAFRNINLPPIGGGKDFYVRWTNDTQTPGYLAAWYCADVVGAPTDLYTCNMEIGDVTLADPPGGSTINLPYIFRWDRRSLTTDSYRVEFNSATFEQRYITAPLGYVSQWQMTNLPGTMVVGTQYFWGIRVHGPNGYGESRLLRSVRFNDTSSPPLAGESGEDLPGEVVREAGEKERP